MLNDVLPGKRAQEIGQPPPPAVPIFTKKERVSALKFSIL
jgi:hypothetical protein